MRLVDIIVGARPNFMKAAPIINALRAQIESGSSLRYRLVHTGQHYDYSMSGSFFDQLNIPIPDINLDVGSGSQAKQTADIMVAYENLLGSGRSDFCLVLGDVTSTMACAITAQKMLIRVGHVEAGIRSDDWTMPEEINRIVTDSISSAFFTTTRSASKNLEKSGVSAEKIYFVGNTMIDTLIANLDRLRKPLFWDKSGLTARKYLVMTLHRPSNVDQPEALKSLLQQINDLVEDVPIIFPVHPRIKSAVEQVEGISRNFILVPPQGYFEFIYLVKHSAGVITDSGGITEEATYLGVPCITLRETTERPETVTLGTNVLVGRDITKIKDATETLMMGQWKKSTNPERWDGCSGSRIASILDEIV